jgi:hypothetical protein
MNLKKGHACSFRIACERSALNPARRPSKTCVICVIYVIAIDVNDRGSLTATDYRQLTTDNLLRHLRHCDRRQPSSRRADPG